MLTKFMFSFFFKSGHWVFTNYVQNIYKIFTEHLDNIYNILCHTFLQNFKLLLHLFSLCSLVFLSRLLFNRCQGVFLIFVCLCCFQLGYPWFSPSGSLVVNVFSLTSLGLPYSPSRMSYDGFLRAVAGWDCHKYKGLLSRKLTW